MALRLERFLDSEKGESLEQSDGFARGLALILSAKTPLTGLNFLTGEATLVWRHFINYIIPILFFRLRQGWKFTFHVHVLFLLSDVLLF